MYAVGEFAKLINRSVKTLHRWDKDGRLKAHRTPTNRRYYTHQQYLEYLGIVASEKSKEVAYIRVSSRAQKKDLENQKRSLEDFCRARGIGIEEWYEDIASGLNYNRKRFLRLLEEVEAGKIKRIVIAHRDRLVRFGYEWIENYCKRHGAEIVTMGNEVLSPEEEIVKDIVSILHVFSCRIYRLRKYKTEISKEIKVTKADRREKKS
jgi:predicted site-specific integrase-resolvase